MNMPSRRAAILTLDGIILVFAAVSLIVLDTGGFVVRVFGVKLTAQTVWRPLVWLGVGLVVRLVLDRTTAPFGRPLSWFARSAGLAERIPQQSELNRASWRELAAVTLGLSVVIAVVLHEQLLNFYGVPDLGDPLFSMWRIGWVAHQLVADPAHLFDANIFYPQPGTLTYSDSMLLTSAFAAPFVWIGVPIAAVYTSLMLLGFLVSGVATYALVRGLSLGQGPAWIAALIFTLASYRFEHYPHLELQMAHWMPLTLLALQRLLATGRARHLLLATLAGAAQWYSSMYYGMFLFIHAGVFTAVLAVAWRAGWRRFLAAAVALLLGVGLALPLARAYRSTEPVRGARPPDAVREGSARPIEYLQPHFRSYWYGDVEVVKRKGERELFPRWLPLVLGAAGLVPPFGAAQVAIIVAGIVSFDGSLGFNGHWYATAYRHVGPFKSMRMPARFAILVNLTLALLAGFAVHRLVARLKKNRSRVIAAALLTTVIVFEAWPTFRWVQVWDEPPSLYAALGHSSGAVLFEYPLYPNAHNFVTNLPYMYFSTWHWTKMVNGYSGFSPKTYNDLAERTAGFPLGESVAYLQQTGVTHVTLHCALWYDDACELTMDRLAQDARFRLVTSTQWQGKPARLYQLARP